MSLPANNSGTNKRQITDLVDQSIQINTQCFVVTADNRYILVSGFWDKSFRVYSSDTGTMHSLDIKGVIHSQCYILSSFTHLKSKYSFNYEGQKVNAVCLFAGKLTQIVFGHWDVVTCLARSESYIGGDCYIVSGSRDATLLLWYWSGRHHIIGDNPNNSELWD